jgi:hypothetical protein
MIIDLPGWAISTEKPPAQQPVPSGTPYKIGAPSHADILKSKAPR